MTIPKAVIKAIRKAFFELPADGKIYTYGTDIRVCRKPGSHMSNEQILADGPVPDGANGVGVYQALVVRGNLSRVRYVSGSIDE
jgi:hypothetical protein